MKKIILACVTTILGLSFINAQEETAEAVIVSENVKEDIKEVRTPEPRSILVGVTAGVNMTTYSGDRNPKMGLGGQVGLNCDIPVGQYFSIMPELIFAYYTVEVNSFFLDNNGNLITRESTTDKLLYMNVPVNLKGSMHLGIGRPFIAVGPMLNVGLHGENKVDGFKIRLFQSDPNSKNLDYLEKPLYNVVDFSVNLKAGYDFDFGLAFSVAYRMSFANMYKMTDEREARYKESGLNTTQKSSTFSVSLGYNF